MDTVLPYMNSHLWQRYLAGQGKKDKHSQARARLRTSFEKTRDQVVPLVAKISEELPQLTKHDITHLDALWSVADTLMGTAYEMNPAEVYVLGMAFLIHDAATSSFAYPGGIEALRETIAWKDFVAQRGYSEQQLVKGKAEFQQALFETLRLLHARHAENLLTQKWRDMQGEERYLLEDTELRNHYGAVIGKLASSHGWSASEAEDEWAYSPPISPHSSLNVEAAAGWNVDCLKLAMLLRCIDAAHVDSLRAPDMEACLVLPQGESRNHWFFQNKLGAVAINSKNELYWSASGFGVPDVDAWWRCYETCRMIDHEVRTSNRILTDHKRRPLRAIGVMGVNDIENFKRNVPVEGWEPLDFNYKISQVDTVIERFGGEKLYGNKPFLALRELIQNSADAIRARRLHTNDLKRGRIDIGLRRQADGSWWLDVQDDGLGMSRYVLTDVLLDFGRSLWKDSSLRGQWAGLASKGFAAVGQFGIGFFSVFMLGDEVRVTTWRYGSSLDDQVTLHLRNRVRERPILLRTDQSERLTEPGTRVSVRLKHGRKSLLPESTQLRFKNGTFEQITTAPDLEKVVAMLAPALDIDLWCIDDGLPAKIAVKAGDWMSIDPATLLSRLNLAVDSTMIKKYSALVSDLVDEDGKVVGRAAVYAENRYSRSDTCVLVHNGILAGHAKGIIGVLSANNSTDLARLHAFPKASAETMRTWARHQVSLGRSSHPGFSERLVSLDVRSKDLIVGTLDGQSVSIADVVDYFSVNGCKELVCITSEITCPSVISESDFEENFSLRGGILDLSECEVDGRYDFGLEEWIGSLLPDEDERPKTVLKVLELFLRREYPGIMVDVEERTVAELDGFDFEVDCTVFSLPD